VSVYEKALIYSYLVDGDNGLYDTAASSDYKQASKRTDKLL